jgi:2Fe-2S ferredoxin
MGDNIKITVVKEGAEQHFDAPNDMGLNLMEFLKATGHEQIEGMCGGMALCATCHIRLLDSDATLGEVNDDEIAMLETLPQIFNNSRLACQVKLNEHISRLKIELT